MPLLVSGLAPVTQQVSSGSFVGCCHLDLRRVPKRKARLWLAEVSNATVKQRDTLSSPLLELFVGHPCSLEPKARSICGLNSNTVSRDHGWFLNTQSRQLAEPWGKSEAAEAAECCSIRLKRAETSLQFSLAKCRAGFGC